MTPKPTHPTSKAFLLCERYILDRTTNRPSLIDVFEIVRVPRFPAKTPVFAAFLQVTDAEGRYEITVEVVDLQTGNQVTTSPPIPVTVGHRLNKLAVPIRVPALRIEHAGQYELVAYANGEELDRQTFLVVLESDDPNGHDSELRPGSPAG